MRDIFSDLINLVHPLPPAPGDDATENERDAYSAWLDEVVEQREKTEQNLRIAWEEGHDDPLLGEIAAARIEKEAAEEQIRLLLAYGREFVEPRPYQLKDLARAAGMSPSGVRTAYTDSEIAEAARRTGARLRRRPQDEEDE